MSSRYYLEVELPWAEKRLIKIGVYYGDCDEGTFIFTQHYDFLETKDEWYNLFKWVGGSARVVDEYENEKTAWGFQVEIEGCRTRMEYENG